MEQRAEKTAWGMGLGSPYRRVLEELPAYSSFYMCAFTKGVLVKINLALVYNFLQPHIVIQAHDSFCGLYEEL